MSRKIRIALSGGGIRAATFHAGVLQWFAKQGQLEQVTDISSVSGGSLFVGLVFHLSGYRWPTSEQYLAEIYPKVRTLLTTKSLQWSALRRLLFNPWNWRFMLSRANVVAQSIERLWGISGTLSDLPISPVWTINATVGESGKRFRFKGVSIGDYETGYAEAPRFRLSAAMAVSAAFPGGIGPLEFDTRRYSWLRKESWDAASPVTITPTFEKVNLYDGGVYDNLGLEPYFDHGHQTMKNTAEPQSIFLVVSDAGAPFVRRPIPGLLSVARLKRVADIAFEQARSLRVRSFVGFLQRKPDAGMYLRIGTEAAAAFARTGSQEQVGDVEWLARQDVWTASSYSTTLRRIEEVNFDLLSRHGFETAHCSFLVRKTLNARQPTAVRNGDQPS